MNQYYEVANGVVTKYYFAGTQRIATLAPHYVPWHRPPGQVCCSAGVRKGGILTFMLSDHLGSTSLTTDIDGNVTSELRYSAWGEVRYQGGTTSTGYQFNGQYSDSYINSEGIPLNPSQESRSHFGRGVIKHA